MVSKIIPFRRIPWRIKTIQSYFMFCPILEISGFSSRGLSDANTKESSSWSGVNSITTNASPMHINDYARYTSSLDVTIHLNVPRVAYMAFSNVGPDGPFEAPVPYSDTHAWTLSDTGGDMKYVYGIFSVDDTFSRYSSESARIKYSATVPTPQTTSCILNNGDVTTNNRWATLTSTVDNGFLVSMMVASFLHSASGARSSDWNWLVDKESSSNVLHSASGERSREESRLKCR